MKETPAKNGADDPAAAIQAELQRQLREKEQERAERERKADEDRIQRERETAKQKEAALKEAAKREAESLKGASFYITSLAAQLDDWQKERAEAEKKYAEINKDWDTMLNLFANLNITNVSSAAQHTTVGTIQKGGSTYYVPGSGKRTEVTVYSDPKPLPPQEALKAFWESPDVSKIAAKYPEARFKDSIYSAIEDLQMLEKQWRITDETFKKNQARAAIEMHKLKTTVMGYTSGVDKEREEIEKRLKVCEAEKGKAEESLRDAITAEDKETERSVRSKEVPDRKYATSRRTLENKVADINLELSRLKSEIKVYGTFKQSAGVDAANASYTRVVDMNSQENDRALQASLVVTGIQSIKMTVREAINRQMGEALREARVERDALDKKITSTQKLLKLAEAGLLPEDVKKTIGAKFLDANKREVEKALDVLLEE